VDEEALPRGETTEEIHIADFLYLPGDQSLSGPLGAVPQVEHGHPLTIVNEDVALGVRHTLTTCAWPCNGQYVANYPQPDGMLDTGKLGNLDYIDGGLVQTGGEYGVYVAEDTVPITELETEDLEPGLYSYYCRIHPWMRGWFEVV
jgi:plastocyanin